MIGDTIPADLFVVVAEALEAADGELAQLEELEGWPVPDTVQNALDRGEVLEAVLRRITNAAPDGRRARIAKMIEEESHRRSYLTAPPPPIMPEIRREIDEARETLRRAALADRDVSDALRRVLPKGWAW